MSLLQRAHACDERLSAPLMLPEGMRVARGAAAVVAHTGDAAVWAALIACGWFFGDAPWKGRALITLVGLVVAEVVTIGAKFILRRPRPPGTAGMIYRRMDPYSFPSGHAARAAMLMVFVASFGVPALTATVAAWGPVMVLSRIVLRIHYVLDVVVGVAIGAGLGLAVIAGARALAASL